MGVLTLPEVKTTRGGKDLVQLLLYRGAKPNMTDEYGMTPIHWAAWRGHKDVVQVLLNIGAEPNMVDTYGETPLSYAIHSNHMDIVNILTEKEKSYERSLWGPTKVPHA